MNEVKQKEAPGVEARGKTGEMANLSDSYIRRNIDLFQGTVFSLFESAICEVLS